MSDARIHLRALAEALPPDASMTVPVAWVRDLLAEPKPPEPDAPWRARLWLVPADSMLTVREAAEALGKSTSAVHKLTQRHRLPFTRSGGPCSPVAGPPLLFRAADLRAYLEGKRSAA